MAYSLGVVNEMMLRQFETKGTNEIAQDWNNQVSWPVRLKDLAKMARSMSNSLLVIVNTPYIQDYLQKNDPKALQQALDALGK